MKEFLQRLQKSGNAEVETEPDNTIVFKTRTPLEITQGELKVEEGISLAFYRLENNVEEQVSMHKANYFFYNATNSIFSS